MQNASASVPGWYPMAKHLGLMLLIWPCVKVRLLELEEVDVVLRCVLDEEDEVERELEPPMPQVKPRRRASPAYNAL